MNEDNPTGEVRPMIDREPPNADKTQGAVVGKDGSARPPGLVRALGALPCRRNGVSSTFGSRHPGNLD
jgi:hypothetical protein